MIDFYVKSDNQVMVIELNPFHIGAGAALFSWRENRDLFLNGPFEFRILEHVREDTYEIIPLKWQKWINRRYHPERLEQVSQEESNSLCNIL